MDAIQVAAAPARHPIVFGVYRDGDNNLDAVQERNVTDFVATTAANPALKVVAEDTTSLPRAPFHAGDLRTESSVIQDGKQRIVRVTNAHDMSDRATLAAFFERTLSEKASDVSFARAPVWIDLVDHGGGDGGGLEADSSGGFMSMEDIAGAIAAVVGYLVFGWGEAVGGVVGAACGTLGAGPIVTGALRRGGTRGGTAILLGLVALVGAALAFVPVLGYLHWSLIDNFEWSHGTRGRFGLFTIDFADPALTRRPTSAVAVFQEAARNLGTLR